jgi:hypothetical protein
VVGNFRSLPLLLVGLSVVGMSMADIQTSVPQPGQYLSLVNYGLRSVTELCQCRSATCLLQHVIGQCGISVKRRLGTQRRTPYCFICKTQRHFVQLMATMVMMQSYFRQLYCLMHATMNVSDGPLVCETLPQACSVCMHALISVL